MPITTAMSSITSELPMREVARLLGLSPTPVQKARAAGIIPDLTVTTIAKLAIRPRLVSIETQTGMAVPAMRVTSAEPDLTDDERSEFGYRQSMTDSEVWAGCVRAWPTAGSATVLAAGAVVVVCGGWAVAFLDIFGIEKVDAQGKIHYNAELVARCDDVVNGVGRLINPASKNATEALQILGLKVTGGAGGSITAI